MRKSLLDNSKSLLWTVILLGSAMRIFLAAIISYGYGEGYYVASARIFALSYFDQPPLSIWMAGAMMKLTGTADPFVIRLPWIALFAIATWAMYRLAADLYGEKAGAFAALLFNLSPVFSLSVGDWVQPDGPLVLFLLLATIHMARILLGKTGAPMRDWALAGLFFGLALISKYHAVLTLAGLFLYVLTVPEARRRFFAPGLAVAAAIAVVLSVPVVLWNIDNHWASFAFQGGRITNYVGIHIDWLLRSILGQAMLIGLLLWPFMMHAWWHAGREGRANQSAWFLTNLAFLPVIIFTLAALWAPLGYHFHWQAPGYLFIFPILAARLARQHDQGLKYPGRLIAVMVAGFVLLMALFAAQATTGFFGRVVPDAILKKAPEARNPLREMASWPELRTALEEKGFLDRDHLFVTAERWFDVGKVDLQVGDKLPVICLCGDPRNPAFLRDHRDFKGWDALIIDEQTFSANAEKRYAPYFDSVEKIDEVDISFRGLHQTTVDVYLAKNYDGKFPLPTDALQHR